MVGGPAGEVAIGKAAHAGDEAAELLLRRAWRVPNSNA